MQPSEIGLAFPEQEKISSIIEKRRFSLPFLLYGSEQAELERSAEQLSRGVLSEEKTEKAESMSEGAHPDRLVFGPEGKANLYTMETVQSIIKEAAASPFSGKYKVLVCFDIDRMLAIHANALLKTLEEKRTDTIFILTTNKLTEILPTVRSRCFHLLIEEERREQALSQELKKLVQIAMLQGLSGRYEEFFSTLELLEKELTQTGNEKLFTQVCDHMLLIYRDLYLGKSHKNLRLEALDEPIVLELGNSSLEEFAESIDKAKQARKSYIRIKHILEAIILECACS